MTDPPSERTDLTFALVGAFYVASVLVPLAAVALVPVVTDPAAIYVIVLAGITVVTAIGSVSLRRTAGLAVWLGATRRRFVPAVAPATVAVLGGAVATAVFGWSVPPLAGLLGGFAAVSGCAVGGVLAVMADTRHANAVTARADVLGTWRAPWPEANRRIVRRAGVAVLIIGAVAFVAGALVDFELLRYAGQFLFPIGIVVTTVGRERTYRATSAGLELQAPVRRHLVDWERFDGYMVTDRAVIVHPTAPWRLPLYFDRDSLTDTDAVIDALGRSLPRLPA